MARRQSDQSRKPSPKYNPSTNPSPQLSTDEVNSDGASAVGDTLVLNRKSFWRWQLSLLGLLLVLGVTGTAALLWLLTMPPPPNCQQISPLAADGERLYCAQQAAQSGKLDQIEKAFALVESWPPSHPLYSQAQQLAGEWAKAILELASQKIDRGDLQGALDLVAKIPKTSSGYSEVEAAVAGWQNNWYEGKKLYDKAQEALKAQDMKKASDYAQALFKLNNAFWGQKRFNQLVEQIALERQGWQRLKEAQEMAKEGKLDKFGEAIALVRQINPKLYAYQQAQIEITRWSRSLLAIAEKQLQAKNLIGALAAANLIPSGSELYAEAQDLMQLGRAQAVTWNQSMGTPLLQHIFALLEGQAAAAQIAPGRPLYQQAQTQIQGLQDQFQDLLRLQMANSIAGIGQPFAFQLAIDQAQMIGSQRPRRVHAQTLVAYWRKEILRIEDQPYLLIAKQLAGPDTIYGLQTAIAQAASVAPGRPRRIEAQTLIAQWKKRIEVLEDQPLFNESLALAKEGKLAPAIDKASKIKKGRALYAQAQTNINQWVAQLQIAQDQPILKQASSLASEGNLTAAINVASQIGYGRALYDEAQSSIARWASERAASSAPAAPAASEPTSQTAPPQEQYSEPPPASYSPPAPAEPRYSEPAPAEPQYSEPAPAPNYAPAPAEPRYSEPAPAEPQYSEPAPAPQEPAPAQPEPAPEQAPPAEAPASTQPPAATPDNNLLPE
ncbi:MAG: hypothetical protein ACM37W_20000 [Actinomycetota bacterium]